jgi:hypothetical protein
LGSKVVGLEGNRMIKISDGVVATGRVVIGGVPVNAGARKRAVAFCICLASRPIAFPLQRKKATLLALQQAGLPLVLC